MSKNLSMVGEVKDGVALVLSTIKDTFGVNASPRQFNDINKKARENELVLYTLASENVPILVYTAVADAINYQIVSSIRHILNHTILDNAPDVMSYINGNFTNNGELVNKLKTAVSDVSDSLGENVKVDVSVIDFGLSEAKNTSFSKKTAKMVGKAAGKVMAQSALRNAPEPATLGSKIKDTVIDAVLSNGNTAFTKATEIGIKQYDKKFAKRRMTSNGNDKVTNYDNEDTNALKIPSRLHTIQVNYASGEGKVEEFTLTLAISVKIMAVESTQLLSALVSAKERNIFYSYIKWRASGKNFFKDFIVNLNELKKQVQRDTSKDLSERILGNLLSKSGFTRPKALAETTELKNFIVVMTTDEVERLKLDHNINLTRGPGLKTIFNNMNIMTLVIYDEVKERLIMFQSDNPTEMNVLAISDLSSSSKMAKLFNKL